MKLTTSQMGRKNGDDEKMEKMGTDLFFLRRQVRWRETGRRDGSESSGIRQGIAEIA